MANPARDPITCHVLDTTTGRPAANMAVKLICCSRPEVIFTSTTNHDGRIATWSHSPTSSTLEEVQVISQDSTGDAIKYLIESRAEKTGHPACTLGSSIWKLQFWTAEYYGAEKCFFPVVELTFLVKEGEHFHVPLLLGPYSYTTYRGS